MVESFKLFVRTYVYWVGLILGFAIVPGSLLFTAEVAPVNTPLWLAPFAGLLLLSLIGQQHGSHRSGEHY